MDGLLAKVLCVDDRGEHSYDIALGKNGVVYLLDQEITDAIDVQKAAIELGFDKRDFWRQPCIVETFRSMNIPATNIICQRGVLPTNVLCQIVASWLFLPNSNIGSLCHDAGKPCSLVPGAMDRISKSCNDPSSISRGRLVQARDDILRCIDHKPFTKYMGPHNFRHLYAMGVFSKMAIEVFDGDDGAYESAREVAKHIVGSLVNHPSYKGFSHRVVQRTARDEMLKIALQIVDNADAWTFEIEI